MKQNFQLIIFAVILTMACNLSQSRSQVAPPTPTPLPTFTATPTLTPQPLLPTPTSTLLPPPTPAFTAIPATATPTPLPSPTEMPSPTKEPPPPTETPVPPPPTATPVSEAPPTDTPTPEPVIKYVLAGTQRDFNCDFTTIQGSVKNANNFGIPNVAVRALGIHESTGLEFTTLTDAKGNYEIFRIPLNELAAAQWAVMVMENGGEVSERFHWASTPVCESDDTGHSQVLRVDWKLIE